MSKEEIKYNREILKTVSQHKKGGLLNNVFEKTASKKVTTLEWENVGGRYLKSEHEVPIFLRDVLNNQNHLTTILFISTLVVGN